MTAPKNAPTQTLMAKPIISRSALTRLACTSGRWKIEPVPSVSIDLNAAITCDGAGKIQSGQWKILNAASQVNSTIVQKITLRTCAEFISELGVDTIHLFFNFAPDAAHDVSDIRAVRIARMGLRHLNLLADAPGMRVQHDHAIGHAHGLGDRVGDEQDRLVRLHP